MGPPPNNCVHIINESILHQRGNRPLMELGLWVWLPAREGQSRVALAQRLLRKAGLAGTDQLRKLPGLPTGRWLCVEYPGKDPVGEPEPAEALLSAAVLGLSAPSYYADDRPVIWTEGRLSRRLRLFRPRWFYED